MPALLFDYYFDFELRITPQGVWASRLTDTCKDCSKKFISRRQAMDYIDNLHGLM